MSAQKKGSTSKKSDKKKGSTSTSGAAKPKPTPTPTPTSRLPTSGTQTFEPSHADEPGWDGDDYVSPSGERYNVGDLDFEWGAGHRPCGDDDN